MFILLSIVSTTICSEDIPLSNVQTSDDLLITRIHEYRVDIVYDIVFKLRTEYQEAMADNKEAMIDNKKTDDTCKKAAFYRCYTWLENKYFKHFKRKPLPSHRVSCAVQCIAQLNTKSVMKYEKTYAYRYYDIIKQKMTEKDDENKFLSSHIQPYIKSSEVEHALKRVACESLLLEFRRKYPTIDFNQSLSASPQQMSLQ
jgi:hypothetical protein